MSPGVATTVEGRRLSLSHLDKPLWPDGWTKGQALHYYAQVAQVMLPHVQRRPASFLRFPDGVDGQAFYVKTPPPGVPRWVPRADVPSRTEGTKPHVTVDDLASLIALGNLGCLEIHVPQWTAPTPDLHDRLVVDLDPGPGVTIVQCAKVALAARALLAHDGLTCHPACNTQPNPKHPSDGLRSHFDMMVAAADISPPPRIQNKMLVAGVPLAK